MYILCYTGVFEKFVPQPVKNIFSKSSKPESSKNETLNDNGQLAEEAKNDSVKEHGNLDFFGRDVLRKITQTASKIGEKIGFSSSNTTSGLDVNKTFFGGVVDKFKDNVKAIYPGKSSFGTYYYFIFIYIYNI